MCKSCAGAVIAVDLSVGFSHSMGNSCLIPQAFVGLKVE